jgi:type I restriction-modification system DNA methylase subunit
MSTSADKLKKRRREEQEMRGYANSSRWYTGLSNAISFLERAETGTDPLNQFSDAWSVAYNLFMMHGDPGDEEYRRFNSWVSTLKDDAGVRHYFVNAGNLLIASFRQTVERVKKILLKADGLQSLESWTSKGVSPEKASRYFFLMIRDMRNTAFHPEFNPNTAPVKKALAAAADCLIPIVAAAVEATIEHPVPHTTGKATAYRFFLYPFLKNSDGFFSDYYLERLFPNEELGAFPEDRAKELLKQIAKSLDPKEPGLRTSDAEATVASWIKPVLFDVLGAKPAPGVRIIAEEAVFQPTFVLPKAGTSPGDEHGDMRGRAAGKALSCLIWTLPWRASLDSVATEPPFTALPVTEVVHRALAASDVPWAIITNGRQLRLLSRSSSHKPRCFLEADLVALLDRKPDPQALRAFRFVLGLFSGRCFTEVDQSGQSLLDRVAEGSDRHGKEIGDELKGNVFSALQELGEGFLAYLRANPKSSDEWRDHKAPKLSRERFLASDILLEDIYHESLSLMYRLLFLFYAESRELLPLDNELYQTYSLESIRDDVHSVQDDPDPRRFFAKGNTDLWARLKELFGFLDKGWGKVIPPYNGGLFDPEKHEFLERFVVGDYYLARAIDLLSRTKPRVGQSQGEGRKKVTYRDLDVRHLGSIYEGILEYAANIADQEYVILRQGSGPSVTEEYKAVADLDRAEKAQFKAWQEAVEENPESPSLPRGCKVSARVEKGRYYLVFGGRESKRKSSGSYYTPDYIVQYIVENTLRPIVRGECRTKPESITGELKAIGWREEPQEVGLLRSEEILELKVVDPAMGSGHFLVAATEYLARAYRDASLREGKVPDEARADQDFVRYKRMIAERCIYGTDINPMAVELAKVSMWLFTMDPGRPLSFLDHHFKCGNALLGAWVHDFGGIPTVDRSGRPVFGSPSRQANLFDSQFRRRLPTMLQDIFGITQRETLSTQDITDKKQLDSTVEEIKRPYVRLANYWLNTFFGGDASDYLSLLGNIETQTSTIPTDGRRFFHWELEFPEVFFEQTGTALSVPGFDAVLGNPPWGAQLSDEELSFFRGLYQRVIARMVDSYIYFIDRGFQLLKGGGALGYIVSSGLLNQTDAWKARSLLVDKGIAALASLGSGVFGPGVLNTSTVVICKPQTDDGSMILIDASTTSSDRSTFLATQQKSTPWKDWKRLVTGDPHFTFFVGSSGASELLDLLRKQHPALASILDGDIQRGVSPDIAHAHVVSGDEARAEKLEMQLLKPSVSGKQIRRYRDWQADQFIIYTTRDTQIDRFPNVKKRLSAHRPDNSCREVAEERHPWWALHRPRDPEIFESPKFIGLTTSRTIELIYDLTDSVYVTDAMYVFKVKQGLDPFVVMAILQSEVFLFAYRVANQGESRIIPQVKASKLQTLPFPRLDSEASLVQKVSNLSRETYSLNREFSGGKIAKAGERLRAVQVRLESLVCQLYGLTDDSMAIVRKTLEGV